MKLKRLLEVIVMNKLFICLFFTIISNIAYAQFSEAKKEIKYKEVMIVEKKIDKATYNEEKNKKEEMVESPTDSIVTVKENMNFSFPLKKMFITSPFGMRKDPFSKKWKHHNGIDLRSREDTLFAFLPGVVSQSGKNRKLGNYIKIKSDTVEVIYGHLKNYFFLKGDKIKCGESIGITGNSGRSTANHLHLSIKENKKYINPIKFIKKLVYENKS